MSTSSDTDNSPSPSPSPPLSPIQGPTKPLVNPQGLNLPTSAASNNQGGTGGGLAIPAQSSGGGLTVPPGPRPSAGGLLRPSVPAFPAKNSPQRTVIPGTNPKIRAKVALAPGHSPLDWAMLTKSGKDLRGVPCYREYTLEELRQHRKRDDAWTALDGKIYNITPYLPFHPGGEKDLMAVAGRDGTKLFMETHSWVNADMMLKECFVGRLRRG